MRLFSLAFADETSRLSGFGTFLLAFGTVAAGLLDLIWRDFDPAHQPIQNLNIHILDRAPLACIAGVCLLLAGTGIFWQRTVRAAIWVAVIIYSAVGLFSIPRFYTMNHKYGFHVTIVLGVLGEMLQQLIVVAGCLVLHSRLGPNGSLASARSTWYIRTVFGLSSLLFGLSHFDNTQAIVHMIPGWMPFTPSFWVRLTGLCFSLAGLAILTGVLDAIAARLLASMLLIFEGILIPIFFNDPHMHQAWGGSAYNLAVAGSVFIYAASLTGDSAREAAD